MSQLPFPERVLQQHIATLGKTGAGKSSAMRVIAEHLLDKRRRIAIIDPKGDWWGLKSSADGKSAGYPVIAFGDFKEPRATDVPINDRSGKEVAKLIAAGNRPCVLGFRGWMPAQLVRFWLDFAPTLFNTNEGELYLLIDEVHNFAPKGKIMDPDSGKCLHWTNRIMSEGRGLGLTFFIASQRPQKVHNDTLDNCETLIAMRIAHPASRASVKDWIDGNGDPAKGKEVLATLAQMKRGEAWIWSPEVDFGPELVKFPMFRTFDSFAPPQLQKKVSQAGWSEVDLDQVKQNLAAAIAEAKANDPKELRAEIQRLKHELSKKHVSAPPSQKPGTDEKAIERAVKQATAPFLQQIETIRKQANRARGHFSAALEQIDWIANLAPQQIPQVSPAPRPSQSIATIERPSRAPILPAPSASAARADSSLQLGEKAILLAAAQCHPADRVQLSILTGYKRSTRNRYIQFLQQKGLVEEKGENIIPTAAGMAALGDDYQPLPTGEELQHYWLERLPEGEKNILAFVLKSGGSAVDREAVSEATGYKRSTRNRYIQFLQARHLLKEGTGDIEPASMLFDGAERQYA